MVDANLFARDWLEVASNCIEYLPPELVELTGAAGLAGFGCTALATTLVFFFVFAGSFSMTGLKLFAG